jgi:Fe-S-cluster containining protein
MLTSIPNVDEVDAQGEWYSKGLRFLCTQCGQCCSGSPGHIYFTAAEGVAMSGRLGLSLDEFYRRHVERVQPEGAGPDGPFLYTLAEKAAPGAEGQDCILLDRSSGRGLCSVYEARPAQCRSWPFWAGNVRSAQDWDEAKANTPCPGMGAGELVPAAEVARLARQDEEGERAMVLAAIDGTSAVEAAWIKAHAVGMVDDEA